MASADDSFYNLRRLHLLFALSAMALLAVTIWLILAERRPGKIAQIYLPELTLDYHFGRVPRIDRCTTCHHAIDGSGQVAPVAPVDATHPRLNLFVGAGSPHPMADFGCTVCHDGQGSATDFSWASHMPNDPAQQQAWQQQQHWRANPDWDLPMLPARFAQSRCLVCHEPSELEPSRRFPDPPAPKLLAGYHLVRQFGCFGCHEIRGFGTMPKVGPSLRDVRGRLSREFLADWIAEPGHFRPTTRMPRLFGLDGHLSGQALADTWRFEAVEIRAVSEYLLAASQPVFLAGLFPEKPSAQRGKKLFQTAGCLACHRHDEFPQAKSQQGPDLSALGGKYSTPAGAGWLENWISDPARYSPQTKMPRPDLEASMVADIAAWLLQSAAWKPRPLLPLVEKDLDELAAIYRRGDSSSSGALRLAEMDQTQKLQYVGRQTIGNRGCYGCHDIAGFEKASPIGPSLRDWGRRATSLLAFEQVEKYLEQHPDNFGDRSAAEGQGGTGDLRQAFFREAIAAHRRDGFVWQKLGAPRSFDYQPAGGKPFCEQLRMGQFNLTDDQREAIVTFVLAQIADRPVTRYLPPPDPRRQAILAGRKVIDKYGCAECHVLSLERWEIAYRPGTFGRPPDKPQYAFLKPEVPPAAVAASLAVDRHGLAHAEVEGMPRVNAHGKLEEGEDDDENPLFYFSPWEPAVIDGQIWPVGGADIPVAQAQWMDTRPAWGGALAHLLLPIVLADAKAAGAATSPVEAWGWLPPALVQEGRRVRPEWLYQYLLAPHPIRPAAVLRMPRFPLTANEARQLVDYFVAAAELDSPYLPPDPLRITEESVPSARQKKLDQALTILRDRQTFCGKCHFLGDKKPGGEYRLVQAPNLADVGRRIRGEYLRRWLADPKSVLPYTPMPVNFPPTGAPLGQDLMPGSSLEQLDAVMDLLVNYDWYLGHRHSVPPPLAPRSNVTPTPAAPPKPISENRGSDR